MIGSPYLAESSSRAVEEPESNFVVARDLAMRSFIVTIVTDPNDSIWDTLVPKAPFSWELNRVAGRESESVIQRKE